MITIGRIPLAILTLNIIGYCIWLVVFSENDYMRSLGVNLFQIETAILAFWWLFNATQKASRNQRSFWLILTLGVSLYLFSNLTWLYQQIFQSSVNYSSASFVIWLLSYMCFLTALIYRVRQLSATISNNSFLFNIIVYMVTVAAISVQYLINPVILQSSESLLVKISSISYIFVDLSILFVITLLYYLNQQRNEKSELFFIIFGFFFQVMADFLYAYFSMQAGFKEGTIIDLFWIIAMLLIGFGGYHAQRTDDDRSLHFRNPFENRESIFPYASATFLIGAVVIEYHLNFNALSFGLLIIFFMIIGRQLLVINANNKLVKEYRYLAYYDQLTGLNNRISFIEDIEYLINRPEKTRFALLLIDLDRFKTINDTMGHYVGDNVLIQTGERLSTALDTDSSVYRLGGDEFVIVLPDLLDNEYEAAAEQILSQFQKPLLVNDYEINLTPSMGTSIYPDNGDNSEELLKNADAAMYLAKANGKNGYHFYSAHLNASMERKTKIESELKQAIVKKQLFLLYQPRVDLRSQKIIGMEALLRWQHPELGLVSPSEFISIAEETGDIIPIGEWVIREAIRQNKKWQNKGFPPMCMSVNVSVLQFQRDNFLKVIQQALIDARLDARYLEIEITETIMQNVDESIQILEGLRKIGVRVSLDDFGTGYSSLHILQKLPIDTLKIDKSFIETLADANQRAMVKTIIELGASLKLDIVAEGIEEVYQKQVLLEHNCDIGQGYLFSRPVKPNEFEKLMMENNFSSSLTAPSSL